MTSIHREVLINVQPEQVWSGARDIGALHTRLVPGFVENTVVEDGARVVTFGWRRVAAAWFVAGRHEISRTERSDRR